MKAFSIVGTKLGKRAMRRGTHSIAPERGSVSRRAWQAEHLPKRTSMSPCRQRAAAHRAALRRKPAVFGGGVRRHPAISKRRFNDAAVHAQGGAVGGGGQGAANVSDEIGHFFGGGKAFEQGGERDALEKLLLKLFKGLAAAHLMHEFVHAVGMAALGEPVTRVVLFSDCKSMKQTLALNRDLSNGRPPVTTVRANSRKGCAGARSGGATTALCKRPPD